MKERRNQKTHFCSFHSRTHPNRHTVNVYCCWLLLTDRHSACHVQHLTVQHIYCTNCTVCNWTVLTVITHKLPLHVQLHNSTAHLLYKLYSLQLNCTYSNYTEAAATCSAAQQERESSFCLLKCSAAGCLMLNVYIDNYIQKLDPSKKFKWLNTHCHNLTAIRNTRLISRQATARRLSLPKVRLGWDDVIQECGVIWHDVSCKPQIYDVPQIIHIGCRQFNTH